MANDTSRRSYSYDSSLLLKDAGLVAASAAATVNSSAASIDTGTSVFEGALVVDVSAIETDTGDEEYIIIVQGSNSSSFANTIENLAALDLGAHSSGRKGGGQTSTVGRYELRFRNVNNDTQYRYLRVYTFVAGTIASGINYTAFVGIDDGTV